MAGGRELLARDIQHMAAELGISISTLLYAKKEMGIGSRLAWPASAVRSALVLDCQRPSRQAGV
jgi:hypothetical protein